MGVGGLNPSEGSMSAGAGGGPGMGGPMAAPQGMMGGGGMAMGSMMGGGLSPADAQLNSLIIVISQTIDPSGWMDMGGSNSISGIDGLIVVRAPEKVHTQIESLLEEMASALAQ